MRRLAERSPALTSTKPIPWYKTEGVNGVLFPTKKALVERMRSIINLAALNAALSETDTQFVLAVLTHHPEWQDKSGCGVLAVEVRMNIGEHFANRGLWLVLLDGSEIDISWPVAIDAAPMPRSRLLRDAARHAIAGQIRAVRDAAPAVCAICAEALVKSSAHVDHEPPYTFESIFSNWLGHLPCGGADVVLDDTGLHPVFASAAVSNDWQAHHALFASLRLVHAKCNLSQGIGGKKPNGESGSQK